MFLCVFVNLQFKGEFFISKNVKHVLISGSYWENNVGDRREVYVYVCTAYFLPPTRYAIEDDLNNSWPVLK